MEDPSDAIKPRFSDMQRIMLIVGFIASIVRLVLRIIFVVVSETPLGIPLIIFSLLAITMLIQLKWKGGCTGTVFYFLFEPLSTTIYWLCMLYVANTNQSCAILGDGVCEDISGMETSDGSIRRPHAFWVALLIPGLIVDFLFIYAFRRRVEMHKIQPELNILSLDRTFVPKKGGGIGGVGNDNRRSLSDQQNLNVNQDGSKKHFITGLNRPVSPGSR